MTWVYTRQFLMVAHSTTKKWECQSRDLFDQPQILCKNFSGDPAEHAVVKLSSQKYQNVYYSVAITTKSCKSVQTPDVSKIPILTCEKQKSGLSRSDDFSDVAACNLRMQHVHHVNGYARSVPRSNPGVVGIFPFDLCVVSVHRNSILLPIDRVNYC